MDVLQKAFNEAMEAALLEVEHPIDDDRLMYIVNESMDSAIPEITTDILKKLKMSVADMLKVKRKLSAEFVDRNIKRWSKGFDLMEMHLVMCTEAGESFNDFYRPHAVTIQDIVFDTLVRMHARACHISSEIICLLKNGYADGAHARWRTLHEVVSTAYFIRKYGDEAAIRFIDHDAVQSYKEMLEYIKCESRLNVESFSQKEIDSCSSKYDEVIEKYGKEYKEPYGWASPFIGNKRPNFTHIENDVGLDHMRPYYKWASHNVHSNVKGMTNKLGLSESREDMLLVGQSDSGMVDPAHATAIALSQMTEVLLNIEPNIDTIVTLKMIVTITDEVGEAFIKIHQKS